MMQFKSLHDLDRTEGTVQLREGNDSAIDLAECHTHQKQ